MDWIREAFRKSVKVKEQMLNDEEMLGKLQSITDLAVKAFRKGNKLLLCGNGGSAADAQHLAAELSGQFYFNRPALFAEALHVNTSALTAIANDFGYKYVFSRQVEAYGNKGDILWAFSTSGNSENVLEAIGMARSKEMVVVGMTGSGGGKMKPLCDIWIGVPSDDTPRIQEAHITAGHIICEGIEEALFGKNNL
ncbi:MAG: D-sedoheptulose 7-phosphate isomerase [Bacteroidales bacterium]